MSLWSLGRKCVFLGEEMSKIVSTDFWASPTACPSQLSLTALDLPAHTAHTGPRAILLNQLPGQSNTTCGEGDRGTHLLPDEMGQESDKETLDIKKLWNFGYLEDITKKLIFLPHQGGPLEIFI